MELFVRRIFLYGLNFVLATILVFSSVADTNKVSDDFPLRLEGITVTPHSSPEGIQFSTEFTSTKGGRVQLFLRNTAPADSKKQADFVHANVIHLNGTEPSKLVYDGTFCWEDFPEVQAGSDSAEAERDTTIPPGALTVFSFNTTSTNWVTPGFKFELSVTDWDNARQNVIPIQIPEQSVNVSSLCFLSAGNDELHPDSLVFYVENKQSMNVTVNSVKIYQPYLSSSYKLLKEIADIKELTLLPKDGVVFPGEKVVGIAKTPNHLRLTTAAIQIILHDEKGKEISLWTQMKVRKENFSIGGGWINGSVSGTNLFLVEPWLQLLGRLHIDSAHFQKVSGYNDKTTNELYRKYPIKMIGAMLPLPEFDNDASLPMIDCAELLGNVQDSLDGFTPQETLEELRIYNGFRIPSSLILTDPRLWQRYAGISDCPQFNFSRLAVQNDFELWSLYTNRWSGRAIEWGAPLELTGTLTRNFRDMNRPRSISAWIQGPFDGWTTEGSRKRLAPTPDELKALAWHTLSSRVISLNWFNLNIGSIVKYSDLLPVIQSINRNAKLLQIFLLYGDAWNFNQKKNLASDKIVPDWDLSTIICPRGALMVAIDDFYEPSHSKECFQFKHPRKATFSFTLPQFLYKPKDVFKIDADGITDVEWSPEIYGVDITDTPSIVGIYVAANDTRLRKDLEKRYNFLISKENTYLFDPINVRKDWKQLKILAEQAGVFVPEDEEDDGKAPAENIDEEDF